MKCSLLMLHMLDNFEAPEGFLGIQGYWSKTGYGIFLYIFKAVRDIWINFRDMGIQCFLKFGDICHICFRDMGYTFQNH